MIYPPIPYPPVSRCSPPSVTGPREDALVGPSHRDFEAASMTPSRPPSPLRSPNASESGAIPTREPSLALDTRAIDLAAPAASVQPPQLQATPQRTRPSAARPSSSSSPYSSRLQSSPLTTRAPPRIGQATSTSNDVHAKAALATEIFRLEHRVAHLRKARRIQLANDRAERDCTARLELRAGKWREASALAAELLLDRFGVVVSAAASTFSSSPLGRPSSTLFGSSTLDDSETASEYLPTQTTTSRLFSSSSLSSSSRGPSHAERLADFRRSVTAAAHARGISEQEVLRQLEEEEGLDPLQSPKVEFDRLLPSTTAGRKRKRRERDFTRGEEEEEEEEEEEKPELVSLSSSASITTRSLPGWKPPRADLGDAAAAPFAQSRMMTKKKEQLSSPRLPPLRDDDDDDDDDDDELMRALDTVIAEGSGPRRFRPPPAGYLPSSQLASDQPHEAQHFDQEKELAGRRDAGGDCLTSVI